MNTFIGTFAVVIAFLFALPSYSQVVNIPDSVFLARLIEEGVDTNGDGKIQISEALGIDSLDVNNRNQQVKIADLSGLQFFSNLKYFSCHSNEIQGEFDASFCPKIKHLYIWNNRIMLLNIEQNDSLVTLDCGQNPITSLNTSRNLELKYLSYFQPYGRVTNIDITKNTKLERLDIGRISLDANTIDLRNNYKLRYLNIAESPSIDSLDLTHNTNLETIHCSETKINSIDLSKCRILHSFRADKCKFKKIDCSGLPKLEDIWLNNNHELEEIILDSCLALRNIQVDNSNLSELNIKHSTRIRVIRCGGSKRLKSIQLTREINGLGQFSSVNCPVTELDFTNSPYLGTLQLDSCKLLRKICSNPRNHNVIEEHVTNKSLIDCVVTPFCETTHNYVRYLPKLIISDSLLGCFNDRSNSLPRYKYLVNSNIGSHQFTIDTIQGLFWLFRFKPCQPFRSISAIYFGLNRARFSGSNDAT